MNKKVISVLIITVIVILAFFAFGKKDNTTDTQNNAQQQAQQQYNQQNQNQAPEQNTPEEKPAEITFKGVTPEGLVKMLKENSNITLAYIGQNVTEKIPGTKYIVPAEPLFALTSKLSDKNETIVIYDTTGENSRSVVMSLAQEGYQNIYELRGGIEAWKQAGNDVDSI